MAGESFLHHSELLLEWNQLGAARGLAWPNIDGWIIPTDQYTIYSNKQFNDVPVLIGYNSDEGASFSRDTSPRAYIEGVRRRYGSFADSLLKAYPCLLYTSRCV